MDTEDLNAGADAPSDLDALVNEAAQEPLQLADKAPPHQDVEDPTPDAPTPSDALRETVEAGEREREARQQQDNRVPLNVLLDEREKRQQYERQVREYEARERQRQEEAARAAPPDQFQDPEGYTRFLQNEARREAEAIREEIRRERMADRREAAEEKFGAEKVRAAYDAVVNSGPDAETLAAQFMAKRNPFAAMVEWHQNQAIIKEVGSDPVAYRQRQREEALKDPEFLKMAHAAIQAQAASNPQFITPQSARRPLPSLGRAGTAASPTAGGPGITTAEEAFGGR